jgi:hypothetical protein
LESKDAVDSFIARFQQVRQHVWQLIILAVALALAINLVSSAISAWIDARQDLIIGFIISFVCLLYAAYSYVGSDRFDATIRAFFVVTHQSRLEWDEHSEFRSSLKLIDLPDYYFSHYFYKTAIATFNESAALKRQWWEELEEALTKPVDKLQLTTETAEYLVLNFLSLNLRKYFSDPGLSEKYITTLRRSDVPEILLSNRVFELISRDLGDRDWYEPGNDVAEPGEETYMLSDGVHEYSRFELSLPKGTRVSRSASGALILDSDVIELELSIKCEGTSYSVPPSFCNYYLQCGFFEVTGLDVYVRISARMKKRLGMSRRRWPYYLWLESFIQRVEKDFGGSEFFKLISWDSAGFLLSILHKNGLISAKPSSESAELRYRQLLS